jgi:excisionase family DNA binding protein
MPRTSKPTPGTLLVQSSQEAVNGSTGEVLTLSEAAAYLRLAEEDVLRLVEQQALPGRRLAHEWRFLKSAIQQWLSAVPPRFSKEAQGAVSGSWKGDPYLEDELRETFRRRGRPTTGDE